MIALDLSKLLKILFDTISISLFNPESYYVIRYFENYDANNFYFYTLTFNRKKNYDNN